MAQEKIVVRRLTDLGGNWVDGDDGRHGHGVDGRLGRGIDGRRERGIDGRHGRVIGEGSEGGRHGLLPQELTVGVDPPSGAGGVTGRRERAVAGAAREVVALCIVHEGRERGRVRGVGMVAGLGGGEPDGNFDGGLPVAMAGVRVAGGKEVHRAIVRADAGGREVVVGDRGHGRSR